MQAPRHERHGSSVRGRAALALALLPLALAADWPQFRGPQGSAVSPEKGLPARWSQTENLRWKAELPGRGLSNPVVAGGRVYVTASSGYQQRRLHVLCFDPATGKQLWERQFWATGNTACHPKTCMAAPTPAADAQHVYALFATGDLVALDADGNLVWYRSLVGDYPDITNQVGMAASPVLAGDVLLVPMENAGHSFAAGIDRRTGQNRWKVDRPRDINWTTPALRTVGDGLEALFQTSRELTALDPRTGQVRWTYSGEGPASIPSPVAAGDLVVTNGTVLRPGKEPTTPEVAWTSPRIRSSYATPLYHEGKIYSINSAGVLTCVQAADGKSVWQERLKGPFSASPVIADGKLYAVNEEGLTSVVALGPEPRVLGTNALGETMLATPALANGALYLRSDKHLYCIAEKK